jgi:hypothetical protein
MADDYNNLSAAIDAAELAQGKLRALSAASPGDSLLYECENRLAAVCRSLIGRQQHSKPPPRSRADAAFYGG